MFVFRSDFVFRPIRLQAWQSTLRTVFPKLLSACILRVLNTPCGYPKERGAAQIRRGYDGFTEDARVLSEKPHSRSDVEEA